jgi:tRNA G18 (ribose-2'-O)-methylase SpoU
MIPMAPAVDSLNVFVSAAVLLYHLRFIAPDRTADAVDRR